MSEANLVLPKLSIIVVSFNRPRILEQCLEAIDAQVFRCGRGRFSLRSLDNSVPEPDSDQCVPVEVIVIRRDYSSPEGYVMRDEIEARVRFPFFRWLDAPRGATIPILRKVAFDHAAGEVIALIEDDCVVEPGWARHLLESHRQTDGAVGGAVRPGQFKTGLDWAVFFCDYARFLPPFEGTVHALPGNNMSYKYETLSTLNQEGLLASGLYEVFVNAEIERRGEPLLAAAQAQVTNINSWGLEAITFVPFHHGRGFGAMRFERRQIFSRLLYASMSLLLPCLQICRIVQCVLAKRRYQLPLLSALPAIAVFSFSWSVGEFMGYLLGPGNSLEQWR